MNGTPTASSVNGHSDDHAGHEGGIVINSVAVHASDMAHVDPSSTH